MKPKIVNCYGGPGTGKSTCAHALFAELKYRGVNCEIIIEYAKDAAWEGRGERFFKSQDYIFGHQHFRMNRVSDQVDVLITDSPILMGLAYIAPEFKLPSLKHVVKEAYDNYDNLDVFLIRTKKYNPVGRYQTEQEAIELDSKIKNILTNLSTNLIKVEDGPAPFLKFDADRTAPFKIIERMQWIWGRDIPELYNIGD